MAEIINDQLNLLKKSSLDVRQTTMQTIAELASYAYFSYSYDGLEVTVLNEGHPVKFTMNSNGASRIRKCHWTISSTIVANTYQDLVDFADSVVQTLNVSSSNLSKAFTVGQKAVVLADETRDGGWSEYIVASVTDAVPEWEYNHADPQKFTIVANSAETSIELYYDNVKVGDSADLSGILAQWEHDQFIASGAVVSSGSEQYIELYYNDENLEPVRIDVSGLQGPTNSFEIGEGLVLSGETVSLDEDKVKEIVVSAITENLIPEGAREALDTLEEIAQYIQEHPDEAADFASRIEDLESRVETIEVSGSGEGNIIEEVQVDGMPLEVVNKSVNIVLSGYATTSDLAAYATSADTVAAINEASRPSLSADTYTDAKALATADNVGKIIEVKNEEDVSGVTYSDGLYIVAGAGEVSKLGVTSATGDLSGDIENLKGRVGTLESNVSNIMDYLYWETDEELEIE